MKRPMNEQNVEPGRDDVPDAQGAQKSDEAGEKVLAGHWKET